MPAQIKYRSAKALKQIRKHSIQDVLSGTSLRFKDQSQKILYRRALGDALWTRVSQHAAVTRGSLPAPIETSYVTPVEVGQDTYYATNDDAASNNSDWEELEEQEELGLLEVLSTVRGSRTNQDNLKAEAANWQVIRQECIDAYRHQGESSSHHQCSASGETVAQVTCITFTKFSTMSFKRCSHRTVVQQVLSAGFFPATPKNPSFAFSIEMLQLFSYIQAHGKCSKEAYALGVLELLRNMYTAELIDTTVQHHFPELFRDAHAQWLTIDSLATVSVKQKLSSIHNSSKSASSSFEVGALHEMCPACFGWTTKEKDLLEDSPSLIFSLDGNMQHKRFKRGGDPEGLLTHPTYCFIRPDWHRLPQFDASTLNRTNQRLAVRSKTTGCNRHFFAADELQLNNPDIDEPGLVLATCRHGSQVRLFDMLPGLGERRAYAALLAEVLSASNPNAKLLITYDIACQFESFARRIHPGKFDNASFAVPALHGYAHQFSCQVLYHCRFKEDFGQTDGEGVERNWSEMDRLVPPLRTSSKSRRRLALCNFVRDAADRKRLSFGTTLGIRWNRSQNRSKDAMKQLQLQYSREATVDSFEEFCSRLQTNIADRRQYFMDLGTGSSESPLMLECIDIVFEYLRFGSIEDIPGLAEGVPLPFVPTLNGSLQSSRIDYAELRQRWTTATTAGKHNPSLVAEIMKANDWLREHFEEGTILFNEALGRGLSREILVLRKRIWLKWSDNMARSKRLRASKTGEKQSAMILRSLHSASTSLRSMITEHNSMIDGMKSLVPDEPRHCKLDVKRLGDDIESGGYLLMPATLLKHPWMIPSLQTRAMENLEVYKRAIEESALLRVEVKRLLTWYEARFATLIHATGNHGTSDQTFIRIAFFEARCLASLLRSLRRLPEALEDNLHNIKVCHGLFTDLLATLTMIDIKEIQPLNTHMALSQDPQGSEDFDDMDHDQAARLEAEEGNGLAVLLDTFCLDSSTE